MKALYRFASAIGVVWLSGCALVEHLQQAGQVIEAAQQDMQTHQQDFKRSVADVASKRSARYVDRPWLVGKAQPLARELTLPLALRANVASTLVFAEPTADLSVIAQRITLATGVPVHVRPDALLPLSLFGPRLEAGQAGLMTDTDTPVLPWLMRAQPAPLADMLDDIAARLGVQWRYDNARIEFYRLETRVFEVHALSLEAETDAALGSRDSGSQQTEGGFNSTSQTRFASQSQPVLEVLRQRTLAFLSRAGHVTAVPGANASLIVTDTPEVLQRVADYLAQENRVLTRRVRILLEELTVALDDSAELGVDWHVLFGHGKAGLAAAMSAGASPEAATAGLVVRSGPFQQSELIIKALGQSGRILRRQAVPLLTLNRRPVSHAVRTTFSYIDQVQAAAVREDASMALPAVSVSQKEQTVGTLLTLVPDVQGDGRILLSIAYDNTVAQPLQAVRLGDQSHPLQLQQITIEGNGMVQQVALHPGQALVVSGFDRLQTHTEVRRLNPGLPLALGGRDHVTRQQLTTLMILTAQVEEG